MSKGLDAAAIRRLAEMGLTVDQIVEVAEMIAPPRSAAAERQARYRERKASHKDITRDVTRDASPTPSLSVPPEPPSTNLTPVPPIVPHKPAKPASQSELAERLWAMANQDGRDRSGKASVRKAVDAAIGRGAAPEALEACVRRHYAEADRGRRDEHGRTFAKGLHRWIEGDHWQSVAPQAHAEPVDATTIARRVQHFRDTGQWKPGWGPPPEVGPPVTFRSAA